MRHSRWTARGATVVLGLLTTVLVVAGACGDGDDPLNDPFGTATGGGGSSGGTSGGDGDSNNSGDTDDPYEGYYEVVETLESPDSCDEEAAESVEPPASHILLTYAMLEDVGPAYVGAWCDSAAEDECDEEAAFVFADVEQEDAEQLPPADERGEGELGIVYETTHWDDDQFACYAVLEETQLTLKDEALSIGYFEHAVRAHEIESPDQCDQVDQVHRNYREDDFSCDYSIFYSADLDVALAD